MGPEARAFGSPEDWLRQARAGWGWVPATLLFIAFAVLVSGCGPRFVVSDTSFAESGVSEPDERLLGAWSTAEDRYIHITANPAQPKGTIRVAVAEVTACGVEISTYRTCLFRIGEDRFMDWSQKVLMRGNEKVLTDENQHAVVKYDFDADGKLRIAFPDDKCFESALEGKKLQGAVTTYEVHISDTKENLRKFFEGNRATLFGESVEYAKMGGQLRDQTPPWLPAARSGKPMIVCTETPLGRDITEPNRGSRVRFAPLYKQMAMVMEGDGKKWLVANGVTSEKYDDLDLDSVCFSADGERLAYKAELGEQWFVVLDGAKGRMFDEIGELRASLIGKRLLYTAKRQGKWSVIVDGVESSQYDEVEWPRFSEDGKHAVYIATLAGKSFVVVDGVEGKRYDEVGEKCLNPSSGAVAYTAKSGDRWLVVAQTAEGNEYDEVSALRFSPDGKRLAFIAKRGDKHLCAVDGLEGEIYDDISGFWFSKDGRRMAYKARRGAKWFVVLDGKEGAEYDSIGTVYDYDLGFTPDGKRFIYRALRGNKSLFVVDGVNGGEYSRALPIPTHLVARPGQEGLDPAPASGRIAPKSYAIRSPDCKRLAYCNSIGQHVLDGVVQKRSPTPESWQFSPDGKYLMGWAHTGRESEFGHFIVVGGVRGWTYHFPWGTHLQFDGPNTFYSAAMRGDDYFRIKMEIVDDPEEYQLLQDLARTDPKRAEAERHAIFLRNIRSGDEHLKNGQFAEAQAAYEKARRIQPGAPETATVNANLERADQTWTDARIRELIKQSLAYFEAKEWVEAERPLWQALMLNPDNDEANAAFNKVRKAREATLWDGEETTAHYAKRLNLPTTQTLDLGGGAKLELVFIPAGSFLMGSPETEKNRGKNETQHEVTISRPFYMGKYEVTVGQFDRFVEAEKYQTEAEKEGWAFAWDGQKWDKVNGASWRKPGFEQKADHPVCEVSWNDAKAFCEWLSRTSAKTVRLPTEAEWECAVRAGTRTAYPWGNDPDDGKGWGNVADQTAKQKFNLKDADVFNWDDGYAFTAPVGKFRANPFGLFDTMGNVWEWCADWFGEYAAWATTDPTGQATGTFRVLRGGSWGSNPGTCRSAFRNCYSPVSRNNRYGFRVVVVLARTP